MAGARRSSSRPDDRSERVDIGSRTPLVQVTALSPLPTGVPVAVGVVGEARPRDQVAAGSAASRSARRIRALAVDARRGRAVLADLWPDGGR